MTNDELIPWLEAGTIDVLISVAVFRHWSPRTSKHYDQERNFDFPVLAAQAYRTHLQNQDLPQNWPDLDLTDTIRQIWQLGYIEEAMAIKSALAQAGVTL